MEFKKHIENLFKESNYLVDNKGNLYILKILEAIEKIDIKLIKLLKNDKKAKKRFFIKIDNIYILEQNKLIEFFTLNDYMKNSSYTAYSNKIGLIKKDNFIGKFDDVVLAFPHKDCILEGGQTKENDKKRETFYNTIISSEEIDRLFEEKVLTKIRKYSKKGVIKNPTIKNNDNLIIKGNNLIALHSLKKKFASKVKLIYIDPPYNTGTDSFGYNDNFNHSTWLTFMKNRIEVAREFLSDDGLLFIHIGDQELHYIKVLVDEIMGRDNFIATIPRKTRGGKSDVPYKLSQDFDWMICYAKINNKKQNLFKRSIERKYYKSDDFPNDEWRLNPITTQRTIKERPNSNFTMINPKNKEEFKVNPQRCWAVTKDTFITYYNNNKIVFPGDYKFLNIKTPMIRVFKSEEIEKKGEDYNKTFVSTDSFNKALEIFLKDTMNSKGTDEMIKLFGGKDFSYPKNELLLSNIINFTTNPKDLIMDFHLGSGTTCAVAHKMGRQYIGIEQMDYIENIVVERLKKVIDGEQGGISKAVNWKGGGEFIYAELKTIDDFKDIEIGALNKNMQYLPIGEIDDKSYNISKEEININKKFYGLKNE